MSVPTYDESQIDEVLAHLVAEGTLREEQASAVHERLVGEALPEPAGPAEPAEARGGMALATLAAAYVGVGLLAAAVGTLIGENWDAMNVLTRSLTFGAITVVLVAAGSALRGRYDAGRGLAWFVAVCSAGALGAALVNTGDTKGSTVALGVGLAALALSIPLLVLRPSAPQQVAFLAALVVTVAAIGAALEVTAIWAGTGLWLLGLAVAAAAYVGVLPVRELGLGVGGLMALVGVQVVASDSLLLCALLGVALAAAGYALALREDPAVPLTVASLTVATVGPRVLGEWLHGSLGASGVLALSGLLVLGAAAVHVRLVRRRRTG